MSGINTAGSRFTTLISVIFSMFNPIAIIRSEPTQVNSFTALCVSSGSMTEDRSVREP